MEQKRNNIILRLKLNKYKVKYTNKKLYKEYLVIS